MASSNCSNGLNGVEDGGDGVCCPEICGVCGGEGCGSIPETNPDDCCAGLIIASGVYCTEGVEAPCILVNDTNTPAPSVVALPFSSPIPIDGPTAVTVSPEGRGDSLAKPLVNVIGGVGGALIVAVFIATVVWYGRRQRRSARDHESKTLPTTGETVLSTSCNTPPVMRPPANGRGLSFDAAVSPPVPGTSSSVVKGPRIVEEIMGRRTSVVKVGRERIRDAKEEEAGSANNEEKRAELLYERGKTPWRPGIQDPQTPSPSSLLEGGSSKTGAAVEYVNTKKHALMDALEVVVGSAHAVASRTSVPLVAEIAGILEMLAKLSKDAGDNASGMPKIIQWCRSMLDILDRSNLRYEGLNDAVTDLLEDVYDAVAELVKIVTCFLRKGKVGRVMTSSLYKRRQEEAEGALRDAMLRLQVGISFSSASITHRTSCGIDQHIVRAIRDTRKERKRRMMEQKEIPMDEILFADDFVLGTGGFSSVHLVEYQGSAAAAKMIKVGEVEVDPKATKKLVKMFVNELHAMIELRSEHIVNVFGAVTTVPGALVLVMEFMEGGNLRSFLDSVETSLETNLSHGIVRDIAQGMALLHSKNAIHGDLKSSNVLLTRENRAKISDFGTVRMMEGITSSMVSPREGSWGVETTLKWAAPEVLNDETVCLESDVYSYGIVVWEIMARKMPWGGLSLRELLVKVLMGKRPDLPAGASPMLTSLVQQCWVEFPGDRLSFEQVLATLSEG